MTSISERCRRLSEPTVQHQVWLRPVTKDLCILPEHPLFRKPGTKQQRNHVVNLSWSTVCCTFQGQRQTLDQKLNVSASSCGPMAHDRHTARLHEEATCSQLLG